jgi:hypothetical protein
MSYAYRDGSRLSLLLVTGELLRSSSTGDDAIQNQKPHEDFNS